MATTATSQKQLSKRALDQILAWGLRLYQKNRFEESLPYFRVATKNAPADLRPIKLLASSYQKVGRKRQARELYRQALEIDPDQTDVLTNLGEILIGQLAYDEALVHLERSMDLDPEYCDPSSQRARALVFQVCADLEG